MVVTEQAVPEWPEKKISPGLQALTAAALTLPGLMLPAAHAADNEFSFQYGRYQEKGSTDSLFKSLDQEIQVDSLNASWSGKLGDRLKLRVHYAQDTWSGASPIASAPVAMIGATGTNTISGASTFRFVSTGFSGFDPKKRFHKVEYAPVEDPSNITTLYTDEVVHVLAKASPEVRNQGDFTLTYEWDNLALDVGAGISVERDYDSRFVNLGGRWDFNRKLTTLALSGSYTTSIVDAKRFNFRATDGYIGIDSASDKSIFVKGHRKDWSGVLGLTQVLSKNTVLEARFKYSDSSGYLSNPYKESIFFASVTPEDRQFGVNSYVFGRYEIRPDRRKQFTWSAGLTQHIPWFDAAVKLDYSFYHDSWGVNAHTFALSWGQPLGYGLTVTPKIRYYSQTAADFYSAYFVTDQEVPQQNFLELNSKKGGLKTPEHFSSDHRLSGFGTLSAGITLKKVFTRGISFEAGFEYYTHEGSLKLGGGGERDFADFHYYVANAAVTVDLAAAGQIGGHSEEHSRHQHQRLPAGVMAGHMLSRAGDVMINYRYLHGNRAGSMLNGSNVVDDSAIILNQACKRTEGTGECGFRLDEMSLNMHRLSLMYAPTDWFNLLVMPQFVDKNMKVVDLGGRVFGHRPTGDPRSSGGVGDTLMAALIRVFDTPHHHLHFGLGISAPTGDIDLDLPGASLEPEDLAKFSSDAIRAQGLVLHYGMQLGSGTWDFKPSLTYTGQLDDWSWGAQVNGTKRLGSANELGYRLGNELQATAWGGYKLFDWLSVSARGVYSWQGAIKGVFNRPHSKAITVDFPENYGGRYWDVGFGLNVSVPNSYPLAGNNLSVEWLQPIAQDVNGFQIEREGSFAVSWSYTF